jgi:hypothetical protein
MIVYQSNFKFGEESKKMAKMVRENGFKIDEV